MADLIKAALGRDLVRVGRERLEQEIIHRALTPVIDDYSPLLLSPGDDEEAKKDDNEDAKQEKEDPFLESIFIKSS